MYGGSVTYRGLPKQKRLTAAHLSGTIGRLSRGIDRGLSREQKLAAIRAITTDPEILGYEMGPILAAEPPTWPEADAEALDLLRAAGADEAAAEANAEWQRDRLRRRAGGGFNL